MEPDEIKELANIELTYRQNLEQENADLRRHLTKLEEQSKMSTEAPSASATDATVPPPATGEPGNGQAPNPAIPPVLKSADELRAELESATRRISELNKENEKNRKAQKALEETQAAAETEAAKEQGKFKDLYEKEIKARETAEAESKRLERERLLDRIATEFKLPEQLRSRLVGETEDELRADAQELAKLIKTEDAPPRHVPDIDATRRGTRADANGQDEMARAMQEQIARRGF